MATKRARKTRPPVTHVTLHCANGRHRLCHGTVYVWTAEGRREYRRCECPVEHCGHGRRDR